MSGPHSGIGPHGIMAEGSGWEHMPALNQASERGRPTSNLPLIFNPVLQMSHEETCAQSEKMGSSQSMVDPEEAVYNSLPYPHLHPWREEGRMGCLRD